MAQLSRFARIIPDGSSFSPAPETPPPPPAYTGPGDIVGGALAWYGMRAYTSASIGANAVSVIRASDSTTTIFTTVAGGGVDVAGLTSFLSGTTGKVTKWWDQVGTAHLLEASSSVRPVLNLTSIGSLPGIQYPAAAADRLTTNLSGVVSQPYTISTVYFASAVEGGYGCIFIDGSHSAGLYLQPVGTLLLQAPSNGTSASAVSTWHAIQGVFNGASSDANIDGVSNTVNPGTASIGANINVGTDSVGNVVGFINEVGIWNSAFSGANSSAMSANQHAFWGF